MRPELVLAISHHNPGMLLLVEVGSMQLHAPNQNFHQRIKQILLSHPQHHALSKHYLVLTRRMC